MKVQIMFLYLRSASIYGRSCRPVTRDFCKETLGICEVDNVVDQLRALGHRITITGCGEIRLIGVQE